jgi:threonyl-tRNA synthetase
MSEIRIILPDKSVKNFDHEPTTLEVAQSIGPRLAKDTLGARINGQKEIIDFRTPLKDGTQLEIITVKSPQSIEVIRHTAAHVMAQAVQELWPDIKVTIGPVIDSGFFYDFDSEKTFSDDDLAKIENKMAEIVKQDLPLARTDIPVDEAIATFTKMKERFKVELIQDLKSKGETKVGIYHQGKNWFDLCRGPHVQSTGQIKAFKLLSVAGAYWRGDEKNPMLQRIYATAFGDKKELDEYLHNLEEAKKRDHRRLGKDMGLFILHQTSPAAPFFTGKGSVIYNELIQYMRDLYFDYGYQEVITPIIFDVDLFHQSGHYANYRENMYFTKVDERDFACKAMNCPSHCLIFASEKHSYKELPIRMADFGRLHRYEKSGVIHGITRVRSFCQDDAHIFCSMDQLQGEIESFMALLDKVYSTLGMPKYKVLLATRPEKRMGSDELWDRAEKTLADGMKAMDIPFDFSPGEGAFYGPKLEIHFVDALNRSWQVGTLQCDFNLPNAFDLSFVGEDNKEHRPVILHRAILGSLERFIGVYLEHVGGHLPTWLAPVQATILNVTDRVNPYCEDLLKLLRQNRIRAQFDRRSEKLNYKIREAQIQKIPYMIVVGDKEAESGMVSVRTNDGRQLNPQTANQFIEKLNNEIKTRSFKTTF